MYLKAILSLVLIIAVSALGGSLFGDGFFDSQKKAKAQKVVDITRDLSNIMQIYKVSNVSNQSVFTIAQNDASNPTADQIFAVAANELRENARLLQGSESTPYGDFHLSTSTLPNSSDVGVYLSLVSDDLSPDICNRINEIFSGDTTGAVLTTPLSGLTAVSGDLKAVDLLADPTVLATVSGGNQEGACFTDADNKTAFVYYVQTL